MADMSTAGFADLAMDLFKQWRTESMFNDSQDFNRQSQADSQNFAREMYRHRYKWAVQDLMSAGLNPMLAYGHGPGASPGGTPVASPSPGNTSRMFSAVQAEQNQVMQDQIRSATDVNKAEVERKNAETQEILARTPTHGVNIDKMRQDIAESIERIGNIHQQIRTGAATATNLEQQTRNLQETIPMIRAQIEQMKTLASLNIGQLQQALAGAQLHSTSAAEIQQRIKANLPEMEKVLMGLDAISKRMAQPGQANVATAQESFVGQLGAYLRAIIPIEGLMGMVPLGRSNPSAAPRDTRRDWNHRR